MTAAITPDRVKDYFHPAANENSTFDAVAPIGVAKYKDSNGVDFNNGILWKDVGIWTKALH